MLASSAEVQGSLYFLNDSKTSGYSGIINCICLFEIALVSATYICCIKAGRGVASYRPCRPRLHISPESRKNKNAKNAIKSEGEGVGVNGTLETRFVKNRQ